LLLSIGKDAYLPTAENSPSIINSGGQTEELELKLHFLKVASGSNSFVNDSEDEEYLPLIGETEISQFHVKTFEKN
jgi:hypothetical protein